MTRYEVVFYLKRGVHITVDVPNGEDIYDHAIESLTLCPDEEVDDWDWDYSEIDGNENDSN